MTNLPAAVRTGGNEGLRRRAQSLLQDAQSTLDASA